jgi:glycosyltransferase involved in cell wall biosynthesis
VRILTWHGWLLEGTGSNVYAAKVAEVWRRQGHHVQIVCQERRAEDLPFVDAVAAADAGGVAEVRETGAEPADGRVVVIRPDIGDLLPVFVFDRYEGFRVKRFVDLEDEELAAYLERNVAALRAIAEEAAPDVVVAGHVVPGPVVARRALGEGAYVAKVHGSDLEYAVRLQDRYAELAREGLEGARAVIGASRDVLARTVAVAPAVADRTSVVAPGVDVDRWRPGPAAVSLRVAAAALDAAGLGEHGRPGTADREVRDALGARDAEALDVIAGTYDQRSPDPAAADRLRHLAEDDRPLIGYIGKLIPEKGVERFLESLALLGPDVRGVVVGFGTFREWLAALVAALDTGDIDAYRWLGDRSPMHLELEPGEVTAAVGLAGRLTFTGRLDHRFAPEVVAACRVLVVPSTLEEAFGMVAAEAAAAGALPVVARHSSLAEVAEALEGATGNVAPLGFEPGDGATRRVAETVARLLSLPQEERAAMAAAARAHVAAEWTWERTAGRLIEAGR